MGVLLASVEPCGQLMEAVLAYGLDQLDCCQACGTDYNLAVLSLLTLVHSLLEFGHSLYHFQYQFVPHLAIWQTKQLTSEVDGKKAG